MLEMTDRQRHVNALTGGGLLRGPGVDLGLCENAPRCLAFPPGKCRSGSARTKGQTFPPQPTTCVAGVAMVL